MAVNTNILEWAKKINKQFETEIIQIGVDEKPYELIPFSSLRLNYSSYGGVPRGRFVEFYGEESSGKSTLTLDLIANAQRMYPDEYVMYIDVEGTYDAKWAKYMGVDSSKVILLSCVGQYAEKIFDDTLDGLKCGGISLAVLDSIGAMFSKQTSEKSIEDRTYGGIAMALTTFVNQATPVIKRNNICFVGINQVRDNIGNMYNPITTPGGRAWKFACSQRYFCRKGKFLDEKGNEQGNSFENPAGHIIEVKLIKSKTCPSDRRISKCSLYYRDGIRQDIDLLDLAVKFEVIDKGGAWYSYNDKEFRWQGQTKVLEELNSNKKLFNEIKNKVEALLQNQGDSLIAKIEGDDEIEIPIEEEIE